MRLHKPRGGNLPTSRDPQSRFLILSKFLLALALIEASAGVWTLVRGPFSFSIGMLPIRSADGWKALTIGIWGLAAKVHGFATDQRRPGLIPGQWRCATVGRSERWWSCSCSSRSRSPYQDLRPVTMPRRTSRTAISSIGRLNRANSQLGRVDHAGQRSAAFQLLPGRLLLPR